MTCKGHVPKLKDTWCVLVWVKVHLLEVSAKWLLTIKTLGTIL